jgi:hypothetical protein
VRKPKPSPTPVGSENLIRNLQRLVAELLPPVFHALAQFNAACAPIRHAQAESLPGTLQN